VSEYSRLFSTRIYARFALEAAAAAFYGICDVHLAEEPAGTRATLQLPDGAGDEVVGEFCNLALAAAIEARLGSSK
jgi:hypothetical protein